MVPKKMEMWAVDLSNLTGLLAHGQEMAKVYREEFRGAGKKEHPFAPFPVPKFQDKQFY